MTAILLAWLCAQAEPKVDLLYPQGAPGAVGEEEKDKPTLTIHMAPADKATGCGIVVCPGGGYGGLAVDHEGKQVAAWLNGHGIDAYVLRYRHAPRYRHPAPLQDALRAIRMVRSNPAYGGKNPDRIGILGFSAGGHLASTAGTQFEEGKPDAADLIERASSRPDFMVLVYPVITMTAKHQHAGSRKNLLGKDSEDPKLMEEMSSEKRVTARTPPTFLIHTTEDKGVPPENSIDFYLALRAAKVPAEMHIYEKGNHGFGLANGRPGPSSWPDRCIDWLRGRGFLPKP